MEQVLRDVDPRKRLELVLIFQLEHFLKMMGEIICKKSLEKKLNIIFSNFSISLETGFRALLT